MKKDSCTAMLVGKDASLDGSTMIARDEDGYGGINEKLFVVNKARHYDEEYVSKYNGFKMHLEGDGCRWTGTPTADESEGRWDEQGINEYNVAMSATETEATNARCLGHDPLIKDGINEDSMVYLVLPFVKTAREGVKRLGQLIEKYGTGVSNGIVFSDNEEVWYLETGSGHHFVAQRIPDDCYAVVANQLAIQEIDFNDPANFIFSTGIQEFVATNHLNPDPTCFNFRNIFGTHELSDEIYSTPRVWDGQRYLTPSVKQDPMSEELPFIQRADRLLYMDDLKYVLGAHFQNTPYDPLGKAPEKNKFRPISLAKTQESHLLQLRPNLPVEIAGLHWVAMGVTAQSVFVPVYAGSTEVHPAYKVGQKTYSSDSAYWVYKLLGVLVDPHYAQFGPRVLDLKKELAVKFTQIIKQTDKKALTLNDPLALSELLTKASLEMQALGLSETQKLTAELITEATDLSPLNFKTDANL